MTAEHDEFCVRAGRICYTPARRVQAVNAVLCSILPTPPLSAPTKITVGFGMIFLPDKN